MKLSIEAFAANWFSKSMMPIFHGDAAILTSHSVYFDPPGGRNRQKMVTATKSPPSKRSIQAVSFPCGLARQSRVQVLSDSGEGWQKYATYHQADAAEACAEKLTNLGITARVVHYQAVPIGG